jgi:hypothetical protein
LCNPQHGLLLLVVLLLPLLPLLPLLLLLHCLQAGRPQQGRHRLLTPS